MKATSQKRLRDLHNWFGVFFTPGIVFFAFSGIFQTLGLHESGAARQPIAPWVGVLASIHKDGKAAMPGRRPPPPAALVKPLRPKSKHDEDEGFPPFKVYVLVLSASLIASAIIGVVVALAGRAARRTWALLAAGCIVPLVLLLA